MAGSGGPTQGDFGANRRHLPRSASSFGASPSANPVSDRKRWTTSPSADRRKQPMQAVAAPAPRSASAPTGSRSGRWCSRSVAMIAGLVSSHARQRPAGSPATAARARAAAVARRRPRRTSDDRRLPGSRVRQAQARGRRLRRRRRDAQLDPEGQGLRQPGPRGRFDATTENAVRDFQSDADLGSDGVVDDDLLDADPGDAQSARHLVRARPLRQPDRLRADAHAARPSASPTRRCPAARRSCSATRAASSAPR